MSARPRIPFTTGTQVDNASARPSTTYDRVSDTPQNRDLLSTPCPAAPADHHLHLERDSGLFLIGLFKLAKAIFFIGISLGALHFIHHSLYVTVDRIVAYLRVDPESHLVNLLLERVGTVTHHKLRVFSIGSSLYAILCITEATGLLLRKVWAEYFTLWLSVSFIPWELYELVRHPSTWRVAILLTNLLVVAYLVWLLQRRCTRRALA